MLTATIDSTDHRLLKPDAPVVPFVYASKLIDLVDREGVSVDNILKNCDLKRSALFNPQATISTLQVKSLVKDCLDISINPDLAFDLGQQLDFDVHCLSYHNAFRGLKVGSIIATSLEYLKVRIPIVELKFEIDEGKAVITIDVTPELKEIEPFLIETIISSFRTMFGEQLPTKRLLVAYRPPENNETYSKLLDTDVIFNSDKHQLVFDPLSMDNLYSPKLANKVHSPFNSSRKQLQESIVDKVRAIIANEYDTLVSLEKVASLLELSPRTCRRRLKTLGYSYKKIRDEILYNKALSYLKESNLPVEDIALKLGYSDNANFRRAFKRWSGKPPSAVRQQTTAPH